MTQHTTRLASAHDRGDPLPLLERNTYWHGKEMGVAEFQRDQAYFRQVQQTLTRLTVGCGILCGLELSPHGTGGVAVAAGAAVDGYGRLVAVPAAVAVDDASALLGPDCAESRRGTFRLCLLHHECPTAPARVVVTDCDTRTECLPGAVLERFRLELRPHLVCATEEPCGCGPSPQGCSTTCGDCVTLGTLTLTEDGVAGVTAEGRRHVVSNVELAARLGVAGDEQTGTPRLCRIWPTPGRVLTREGSPSEWGRWRQWPRVELTFDQPIDLDRVDDPDDWLRAWVATEDDDESGSTVTFTRVGLRFLPTASLVSPAGHRLVYEFRSKDTRLGGTRQVVLVQARATQDSGPAAASPAGGIARIEYAGTPLTRGTRARIWRADRFSAPGTSLEAIMGAQQPRCFGDPYDGGRVHAVFAVEPVGDGVPQTVTAVHPANAARVSAAEVTIEIAGTGALGGLAPRAWILTPDGPVKLALQPAPPRDGVSAAVMDRFPASFDTTVHDELREVLRFTADMTDLRHGKVLVVVPAQNGDQQLGSFAGTCLADAEAAHVYAHGPSQPHYRSIRPSRLRMPRAGQAGAWIHWTFYWEHDDEDG